MARHLAFFAAPVVWLFTAATLCAQTALLNTIPDDVLGLVVVNNLSDASAKVHKLTEKMNIPVPELLPIAKMFAGEPEGIDDNGSIAAVALADDDEDATWGMSFAAFVPVTDYQAFIKGLKPEDSDGAITKVTVMGRQYLLAKKGTFAVLCNAEQKSVLEVILASTKSISGTLAPLGPWLAEQQIAIVVTPAGKKRLLETIVEKFADADKESASEDDDDKADRKQGDTEQEAKSDDEESPGKQAIQSLKDLFASGESQLSLLGLGIRIDEQIALHVSARVLFTAQGALAQWAETIKPPKGGLLVGLPPGKFVVAYGGVSVQLTPEFSKLIELLTNTGLEKLGLDDELRKQYATVLQRHRANQLTACGLLGPLRPGDSITATSVAVEHVKNAAEHLKLTRDLFQLLQKGSRDGDSNLPVYELNEVTIGDLKALELVTDMSALVKEFEGAGAVPGAFQGFMSGIFGSEGKVRAYFAVADDTHLVSAYSKPLLQRGVEHVRSGAAGLETDPQIAQTNGLLPGGAQWAAYASPQGLVQWVDTLLRQAMPAEMKFKLPPFPPSDPIGLAAKVSATGLEAELVLPESVVAGIGQYVILVQQMIQGGQAPLP
ncbi:MAG: hypothetical protein HY288_00135 [Planctomycetia bacterium]|nr:hypothetical protein [Planctomycetia bacterium]